MQRGGGEKGMEEMKGGGPKDPFQQWFGVRDGNGGQILGGPLCSYTSKGLER